jgi:hypothetical protein
MPRSGPKGPAAALDWNRAYERARVDGAFMEPSGRNRWQPVANETVAKNGSSRRNRCRGLRPVADRSAGKEGVDSWRPRGRPKPRSFANRDNGRIPRTSRRRSPKDLAGPRKSPQRTARKALLSPVIPAYPRSGRKRQDRPVTPEVAGSPGLCFRRVRRVRAPAEASSSSCPPHLHPLRTRRASGLTMRVGAPNSPSQQDRTSVRTLLYPGVGTIASSLSCPRDRQVGEAGRLARVVRIT